ncbi:hypothetical protein EJB05_50675 [Eragrostis curvula]|uniref:Embryo surrounding factor 1 brassicaceae domain-containing protein n=1 Tax=Eragrostis curvula TaxID=38414 RepID=A0A5J9SXT4_9POAL|nr:hypothetical protein EJB05_50675 [Eragrostis curvula]
MRNNGFSGLVVHLMAMFFLALLFGSLASPASGRPQLLKPRKTVNSTSLEESKIYIVLCIHVRCNYFGNDDQMCYCCGDENKKENCHPTLEECKNTCPLCNQPKCLSQLSVQLATQRSD